MSVAHTREAVTPSFETSVSRRRKRHWKIVRLLLLTDIGTILVATVVAASVVSKGPALPPWEWAFLTVPLVLAVFSFYRLYERDRSQISVSTLDELRDVVNALGIVCFAELALGLGTGADGVVPTDPITVFFFWLAAIVLIPLSRALVRHAVIPRAVYPQSTIVVGAGRVGQQIVQKILKHPEYNVKIVGFLDDDPVVLDESVADVPVLGAESDIVDVIKRNGVSRVILAFSRSSHESVLDVIRNAGLRDVHLSIVPRYFEIIAANVGIGDVEGISVIELPEAGLSRLARVTKRLFDLVLTVPGVLVLSPLLIIVAIAIKLDSRGPVFFRQARMGRHNKQFRIIKFRTMVADAESRRDELLDSNESTGPLFKIKSDPRVTRVGAVLRRYSLDELPQLLNVLKGEMSLVGPRPFVIQEDIEIDGWARRRLDLTPGMTGLWQVLGRNDIGYDEMVKLDYLYVTNWSLWWDIKLLLRTIPIVVGRRGW
jgi:exopolysaccharide biosynthesis polyprenyl glycosylphosphotransferase